MLLAFACLFWLATIGTSDARAANVAPLNTIAPATIAPPPAEIAKYIKDNTAAIKLGKALFWDMQAGSDGRVACATCHFNAGADSRTRNTIGERSAPLNFNGGANTQLSAGNFPLHVALPVGGGTTTNVIGSQGVIPSTFAGITPGNGDDDQIFAALDADFKVGSVNVRRSTGRNTPSVINAVLNFRNFWDGRAQNDFNGVNPFGKRDAGARVFSADAGGNITPVQVTNLTNSALASQADGPPGNNVEMSSDGRSLADIGRKLMAVTPLGEQKVSGSDSVLGGLANGSTGLATNYKDMISAAFQNNWWNSANPVAIGNRLYTQAEANFSLFWGLSIQAYEQTLISDQDPFDKGQVVSGIGPAGLGLQTFNQRCSICHSGAAMSTASIDTPGAGTSVAQVSGAHDVGFENIGVTPNADDGGQAGPNADPTGGALSVTRFPTPPVADGVDGTFKVPNMRNVDLTAPYFHNGDKSTLDQVLDLYIGKGNVTNPDQSTALATANIQAADKANLEAFFTSLTDPRVVAQSAPFDHPELFVAQGEKTTNSVVDTTTDAKGNSVAVDCFQRIPETGNAGGAPIPTFASGLGSTPACATPPSVAKAAVVTPPNGNPGPNPGPGSNPPPGSTPIPISTVRCHVPSLKGKSVTQARAALKKAHCKLGKVTRKGKLVKGAKYRISAQQFKAKSVQRNGRSVKVTISRVVKKHK